MAKAILAVALVALVVGCNSSGSTRKSTEDWKEGTGFMTREVKVEGQERKYGLFVPRSWEKGKRYPAIIFLHGVLESGSDAKKNMGKGLGPFIAKRADEWPFVTIFPQSSGDWQGDERARLVIACLDEAVKEYGVDPERVILTGLSNGGQGTWLIGSRYRDRFAGLIPMCAHSAYDAVSGLTRIPIWAFHNKMDMLVSPGGTREMAERIEKAGGKVKLTMYGGLHGDLNHNCWDQAYREDDFVPWMLRQRRGGVGRGDVIGR